MRETGRHRDSERDRDRERQRQRDRERETETERDREKILSYIRVSIVSASCAQVRHTMLVNYFLLIDEPLASPRPVVQTHILRHSLS